MRIYVTLILIFGLATAGFGALWLGEPRLLKVRKQLRLPGSLPVARRVEMAKVRLFEQPPALAFDLLTSYGQEGRTELVDPKTSLPAFAKLDVEDVRRLDKYATSCKNGDAPAAFADPSLAKALVWAKHFCGALPELPEGFFWRAPFMHPGGRSYALLHLARLKDDATRLAFVTANIANFHVTELAKLPPAVENPDAVRKFLGGMSRTALQAITNGESVVREGERILFYVSRGGEALSGGEYRVYTVADWDNLRVAVQPVLREEDTLCQYGDGAYCWVPVANGRSAILAIVTFVSLAGLCVVLAVLAVSRIRAQRRDRQDQLFVLKTLTHELRTPVTGLNLTLETMREDFDKLPGGSQSSFLRLCDESQRLSRVIAMSARYLKMGDKDRFEISELPSLRAYLESVLEPYQGKIETKLPERDRAFRTDPYWLRVCITNLIENALTHGKRPVEVGCELVDKEFRLTVKDGGALTHGDVEKLAHDASRRDGRGLGLGLGIILRTVRDLGGALTLSPEPTTFTLKWKESP